VFNDCAEFMNRTLSGPEEISLGNALGSWIAWNLYGRKELDEAEMKIISLGDMIIGMYGSCWK